MTVVFLHPIGLDGQCWQFVTPELDRPAVCYDMLWHGGRDRPEQQLSLNAFAVDVLANTTGPLDLVGLSMGGAVTQEIAINYPDRVRSAMIACSSAGGNGGVAQLQRAEATEATGMEGMLDSTLRRWFTPAALAAPEHAGVQYTVKRLLSDSPEAFAASWRALAANNAIARLATISAPTTVLHAAQDAASTLESKQHMADLIPGSRLDEIPGPHMVQLESPAIFARAVRAHLDWVDAQLG